ALARAFLKDAPIVLLDEPTANLDASTEEEIVQTIKTLIHDRTAIIATHRKPLVDLCGTTVRVVEGRVTELVRNV
ncbi:MAG: thiol reductant ABC exporter subunit CydD, partial [Rubrobacter sp.]